MIKDSENHKYFVKSEHPDPTLYITNLPQFGEEFKSKGKSIVFVGESFIVGLSGDKETVDVEALKKYAEEVSTKPAKCNVRDKVSFKFKEKGKKAINATGVCMFNITGQDLPVDKFCDILTEQGLIEMD